jgi:hypothetical protein
MYVQEMVDVCMYVQEMVDVCMYVQEMVDVCMYVQESLNCVRLDLEKYCQDKNFEVCAIKIHLDTKIVCTIAI